jgi:hypothetical protein
MDLPSSDLLCAIFSSRYFRHSGARSEAREPGIHSHDREYGFRACAKWRIPE